MGRTMLPSERQPAEAQSFARISLGSDADRTCQSKLEALPCASPRAEPGQPEGVSLPLPRGLGLAGQFITAPYGLAVSPAPASPRVRPPIVLLHARDARIRVRVTQTGRLCNRAPRRRGLRPADVHMVEPLPAIKRGRFARQGSTPSRRKLHVQEAGIVREERVVVAHYPRAIEPRFENAIGGRRTAIFQIGFQFVP